jgi:hypothetical protein
LRVVKGNEMATLRHRFGHFGVGRFGGLVVAGANPSTGSVGLSAQSLALSGEMACHWSSPLGIP